MRTLLLTMVLMIGSGCASMTVVRVPVTCTSGTPVAQDNVAHERPRLLKRLRDAIRPSAAPPSRERHAPRQGQR